MDTFTPILALLHTDTVAVQPQLRCNSHLQTNGQRDVAWQTIEPSTALMRPAASGDWPEWMHQYVSITAARKQQLEILKKWQVTQGWAWEWRSAGISGWNKAAERRREMMMGCYQPSFPFVMPTVGKRFIMPPQKTKLQAAFKLFLSCKQKAIRSPEV